MNDTNDLNARLLAAHAAGDHAQLVRLYTQAAETAPNDDAVGFFLTHAYVFALEMDHPDAPDLKSRLVAAGRDSPDAPS